MSPLVALRAARVALHLTGELFWSWYDRSVKLHDPDWVQKNHIAAQYRQDPRRFS